MTAFHLLRPWWLLGLIAAGLLSWRLWTAQDTAQVWRKLIAPHLWRHLVVGRETRSWLRPETLLPVCWAMALIALSGPTWRREPAPFADDVAALAVVVKVAPSMLDQDVRPNRLTRGVEKLDDLLKLRPGGKTALYAYSGSTHRVMPLTTDAGIIHAFADELAPPIMPVEGDRPADALAQASRMLEQAGQGGWILWIADEAPAGELSALRAYPTGHQTPVTILAVAAPGPDRDSLEGAASALGASLVDVTADDADVRELARNTRFSTVEGRSEGDRWIDYGYWLVPPLTVLALAWFRRGWLVPLA